MRKAPVALLAAALLACSDDPSAKAGDEGAPEGPPPDLPLGEAGAKFDCGGRGCDTKMIALGSSAGCALLEDGSVACYGGGIVGTLGRGVQVEVDPAPQRVKDLRDATAVYAGGYNVCAVHADKGLSCWGADQSENPYSTRVGNLAPVRVEGLADVVDVAIAISHTCALVAAGDLYCWGSNYFGELGDGTHENRKTPVKVVGLSGAKKVTAGNESTCAIGGDGAVWCWGMNDKGQLGQGTQDQLVHESPLRVEGTEGALDVAAAANAQTVCALLEGGSVKCWGEDAEGTGGALGASALGVGWKHGCALVASGEVSCWGENARGQLGDGSTTPSKSPTKVSGVSGARSLAVGGHSACAVFGDGSFACWGDSKRGQLGDGTTDTTRAVPVRVHF